MDYRKEYLEKYRHKSWVELDIFLDSLFDRLENAEFDLRWYRELMVKSNPVAAPQEPKSESTNEEILALRGVARSVW